MIAYVLKSERDRQGYWQYSVVTGILVALLIPFMVRGYGNN